jgi:hypothetical protein
MRPGPAIGWAYLVKAEVTPWRNSIGDTFIEAIGQWLRTYADRFPTLPHAAQAIEAGQFCGVFIPEGDGEPARYLLTQAAMTACVAEQGLACATASELHHQLCDLVEAGHLAPRVQFHTFPGIGEVWCYALSAGLAE